MSVELGLAIVGTVDICFKYGKLLVELYSAFKSAKTQLAEQVLRLESIWLRTRSQLEFLQSVWQTLDEPHQLIQCQILDVLSTKLRAAVSKAEGLLKDDNNPKDNVRIKRWKFALFKEGLDRSIEDLETWQKIFDPSWFLIMKIANPRIDHELSSSVESSSGNVLNSAQGLRVAISPNGPDNTKIFLPPSGLDLAKVVDVPYSNVKLVQREGSRKWLLTEKVADPSCGDSPVFEKNVREIARKLSHSDPTEFRLFNCYGVIRHYVENRKYPTHFTFVFRMPEEFTEVHSLRFVLDAKNTDHTLSERFQIAKDLARAVSYVHSFGFVHKNIRPETILLLKTSSMKLGFPFLVGFQAFRSAEAGTARLGDTVWSLNLYRHPSRQGERPVEDYVMQHDIYSLGVCLLELGMFQTFIAVDDDATVKNTISPLAHNMEELSEMSPNSLKMHLVAMAQKELPRLMGTKYADVVVTCLTCLDEDNIDFGDESEFQDADGILVSVRYIEKVLGQLNDINV